MELSKKLRRAILNYSYESGACHIGSALSCVEILIAIDEVLKKEDFFIFSKASGVSAYYALLAEKGGFEKQVPSILKKFPLPSKEIPGIIHSTGSLGHGLPVAVGLAYSNPNKKVYCLMGDGEVSEGTTWESLLFASHHDLKNLTLVIDRNFLQACGGTEKVLKLGNLKNKIRAFDWCCTSLNGHDLENLRWALRKPNLHGPYCIIAETVKGKGVDFLENKVDSHYKNLDKELLEKALCQI